jgi:hypothetical protein
MEHFKHNLSEKGPSLRYTVADGIRLVWQGPCNDIMVDRTPMKKVDEAKALLREVLADGDLAAKAVLAAAEAKGISGMTLHRAKEGVATSYKNTDLPGAPWMWRLVDEEEEASVHVS